MKKFPLILALSLTLFSGCALWPSQVEFFQKKIQAVPVLSDAGKNRQKQAAAVLADEYPTNNLAEALSESLGPPSRPFTGDPDRLADSLLRDLAVLDNNIQSYAERVDPLAGKKIEGTGLIKIGYFTMLACVAGLFALLWFGVKIYGIFNPIVGTAAGVIGRVASSTLSTAASEVVSGGEQFLHWVGTSDIPAEVKSWITSTFKVAQQTAQSPATQTLVKQLTTTAINPAPAPVALTLIPPV